jgi:recombinational DNA repair protein RecT
MGIKDVYRIRDRSSSYKNDPNKSPWTSDFDEMAKKTILKRISKYLKLDAEARDAMRDDDDALTENERFAAAKPIFDTQTDDFLSSGNAEEPKNNKQELAKV